MQSNAADQPAELEFAADWEVVENEKVHQLRIVAPMTQRAAVENWFYNRGGRTTRSGPAVLCFPKMDMTRCDISGWVPIK